MLLFLNDVADDYPEEDDDDDFEHNYKQLLLSCYDLHFMVAISPGLNRNRELFSKLEAFYIHVDDDYTETWKSQSNIVKRK